MTDDKKMETQKAEFNALDNLSKCRKNLQLTPIVDDDYPECRHYYESALQAFLVACRENGRTL